VEVLLGFKELQSKRACRAWYLADELGAASDFLHHVNNEICAQPRHSAGISVFY
jgi:hypothetical protein